MKTIIYTLGIVALLVSPITCSKEKLDPPKSTNGATNNGLESKDDDEVNTLIDDETTLIIDPTKPIPKP